MFVLSKVDNDQEKIILLPSKGTYTIGRLSTDVVLAEDLSISRTHVRIRLTADSLSVEDLGSRYGTYVNDDIERNKKMAVKAQIPLQIGNKIRFGAIKNTWKLSQLRLITTASALNRTEILELSQLIKPLSGTLVPSWTEECSHLTMETVTVTVKLLHALLENKPIVRVAFWRELLKVARRVHVPENLPDPKDFAPILPEEMPSIEWRPERTKLFAGKTFVFMNRKHLEMYGPVVLKAGGTCKDLNSGVRKPFLTKPNVVVIQYVTSTQSQATETIFSVQGILEQAGLRAVPDYEIGLAILHCSLQKFCNPSHKIMESLATTESMDSSILVPNTERSQTEGNTNKASEFVVAESEKSQIYALSVGSDEQVSAPKPQSVPKPAQKPYSKKGPICLDSSNEEDNYEAVEEALMNAAPLNESLKRKVNRILDASEDDLEPMQTRKKSKTLPLTNSLDKSSTDESDLSMLERDFEEGLVTACQMESIEPTSSKQKKMESISPQRSTRSRPQQKVETPAKKVPAPAVSPRRSLRGKQATEKVTLTIAQSDSEDDEGLFQFKSQAPEPVKRSPAKPIAESNATEPEESVPSPKIDKPTGISVRKFLGKSQSNAFNQSIGPAASQSRKRVRLQQINESDSDDNENLFQFGGSKKPRRSNELVRSDNESDDENMFNFSRKEQPEQSKPPSEDDQNSVSTEPFAPVNQVKSKYFVPKPGAQPRTSTGTGWVSCNRAKAEVKPEPDASVLQTDAEAVKKEEPEDDKDQLEHAKWLASIKDSIQVRMCNMSISVRNLDDTDAPRPSATSDTRNFKRFKKGNVRPQQHIIGLKRMQLAEGMVTSL